MTNFTGNTVTLSDTVDQWGRKIHINVRNDKVTLVYRWKSRKDTHIHTQRTTLDDVQVAKLIASLCVASGVATYGNTPREAAVLKMLAEESKDLSAMSK